MRLEIETGARGRTFDESVEVVAEEPCYGHKAVAEGRPGFGDTRALGVCDSDFGDSCGEQFF